jgi:hypothetical protein
MLLLQTLSHLHKSRRDSNCCSFFAGAAGGFCIPRAAVAEDCRRCCLDSAESAAHRTITG